MVLSLQQYINLRYGSCFSVISGNDIYTDIENVQNKQKVKYVNPGWMQSIFNTYSIFVRSEHVFKNLGKKLISLAQKPLVSMIEFRWLDVKRCCLPHIILSISHANEGQMSHLSINLLWVLSLPLFCCTWLCWHYKNND